MAHFIGTAGDFQKEKAISDLDFADSFGNIDHLVIGPPVSSPSDAKNWRGVTAQQREKPRI